MSGGRAGTAGFTLVEMLVALTILAVVAGLGAGVLARRDPVPPPRAVAGEIQAMLLRARSEAIRTGRDQTVAIDLDDRSLAHPPGASPLRLPPGVTLTGTLARPAAGGARAGLVFRPDGSSSGGRLEIAAERRRAVIEVDWLTGLPRLVAGEGR